ncbi:M20/M25/M40 family metallo-hydrolase [Runella slithyformis]|uniref:Peptidase M28 n=1 Tax=Runella slithyformis (strain ATCC 29530 / DSM 19594 / LMG 11500 / NCIMB 11436 / LSU 4) TaxID=761193 RepID=A0A7U3ZKW7_RUNSL|nr:M20/M25/M40 family metallo-hydrolase [Runella slithyformis]AEI49111.1 peptidase M28 [Runella slithyformis DSM 19594]
MKYILCTTLIFVSSLLFGQAPRPDADRIAKHIYYLASDKMKGRGTGSKENAKAANYLIKQFKKLKLTPLGTDGYRQPFTAKVRRIVVPDSVRPAANVIGFLDNGAPYTIVIGAHYDHLGTGSQGSSRDKEPQGKIHNGADDNASGVAGMLELARCYATNDVKEPYNFLFIGFGAEELGLVGSRYFVNNPTLPLEKIHFMSNLDMIGRYNADRGVGIGGYGTSDAWPEIFKDVKGSVKFFTDRAGSGGADHASFYAKKVPVLFFHTGGHDDYHMPTDDAEKIDIPSAIGILDIHIQLIENAMKRPKLVYTEVK